MLSLRIFSRWFFKRQDLSLWCCSICAWSSKPFQGASNSRLCEQSQSWWWMVLLLKVGDPSVYCLCWGKPWKNFLSPGWCSIFARDNWHHQNSLDLHHKNPLMTPSTMLLKRWDSFSRRNVTGRWYHLMFRRLLIRPGGLQFWIGFNNWRFHQICGTCVIVISRTEPSSFLLVMLWQWKKPLVVVPRALLVVQLSGTYSMKKSSTWRCR